MALDRTALRHELDLAAEDLDRQGHKDLATKVDRYAAMLMRAKDEDIPLVHRGLCRIQADFERRVASADTTSDSAKKAQAAVLSARRSAIQRKIAIKRLLRERAAKRQKEVVKTQAAVEEKGSPMKSRVNQRVAEAEQDLKMVKHRIDRLRRIQSQMK